MTRVSGLMTGRAAAPAKRGSAARRSSKGRSDPSARVSGAQPGRAGSGAVVWATTCMVSKDRVARPAAHRPPPSVRPDRLGTISDPTMLRVATSIAIVASTEMIRPSSPRTRTSSPVVSR